MKNILAFFLLVASCLAQNFVTVESSLIHDSGNTLLASGSIFFAPVDASGNPLSYQAGGGGPTISWPVVFPIVAGAFTGTLANSALTNPANVCFQVTVKNANNQVVLGGTNPNSGYQCAQTANTNSWCLSGTCDFDQYFPQAQGLPLFPLYPPTAITLGGVYSSTCAAGNFVIGYSTSGVATCNVFPSVLFGSLGTPVNGTEYYCSDCKNVIDDSAIAGAACIGTGHGSLARRENGHWACN